MSQRAGHRCEYCHAPEAIFNLAFEVEHVIPISRQGADDESNLALACRACNLRKADYLTGAVLGLWTLGRCPVPALALSHYLQGVRGYLDSLRPGAKRRGPSGSRADRAS